MFNTAFTGDLDWINHVEDILYYHSFGQTWSKPEVYKAEYIANQLRIRQQDISIQEWFSSIENDSKPVLSVT